MAKSTLIGALTLSAGIFAFAHLHAQQTETSKGVPQISTAEYRPLTFWDRVRIGGAYFTNPSYVKTARIAYGFNSIPQDQAIKLVNEGRAVLATVNQDTGNAVIVATPSDWKSADTHGTLLLSKNANLLGQSHSSVWVRSQDNSGGTSSSSDGF